MKLPVGTAEALFRHCTPIAVFVLLKTAELTIFEPEATVTEAALGKSINVSGRAIREAMDELEEAAVLTPRSRTKYGVVVCRPRWEHLKRMKPRTARTRAVPDPEPEHVDQAPAEPPLITPAAAARVVQPVHPVQLTCPVGLACPVTHIVKIDGVFRRIAPAEPLFI